MKRVKFVPCSITCSYKGKISYSDGRYEVVCVKPDDSSGIRYHAPKKCAACMCGVMSEAGRLMKVAEDISRMSMRIV